MVDQHATMMVEQSSPEMEHRAHSGGGFVDGCHRWRPRALGTPRHDRMHDRRANGCGPQPRGCMAVCMGSDVCPRESTERATRFE